MTVHLRLVRHGRTGWNAEGRFLGWRDEPLDEVGVDQARRLASILHQSAGDQAWTSDLVRARQTAALAGLDAVADRRLREFDFGRLEGRTWDALDECTREGLRRFDGFSAPGGESSEAFRTRVVEFLDELPHGRHVVVTHGGVIRVVLRVCGSSTSFPGLGATFDVDWTGRSVVSQSPTR